MGWRHWLVSVVALLALTISASILLWPFKVPEEPVSYARVRGASASVIVNTGSSVEDFSLFVGDDGRSFAYSIDTTDSVSLILANEARIDLDERERAKLERWGAVVEEVDRWESEFAQLQIISFPAQVEGSGELVLPRGVGGVSRGSRTAGTTQWRLATPSLGSGRCVFDQLELAVGTWEIAEAGLGNGLTYAQLPDGTPTAIEECEATEVTVVVPEGHQLDRASGDPRNGGDVFDTLVYSADAAGHIGPQDLTFTNLAAERRRDRNLLIAGVVASVALAVLVTECIGLFRSRVIGRSEPRPTSDEGDEVVA